MMLAQVEKECRSVVALYMAEKDCALYMDELWGFTLGYNQLSSKIYKMAPDVIQISN